MGAAVNGGLEDKDIVILGPLAPHTADLSDGWLNDLPRAVEGDTATMSDSVDIALEVQDTGLVKQHQLDEDHDEELWREDGAGRRRHDEETFVSREDLRIQLLIVRVEMSAKSEAVEGH